MESNYQCSKRMRGLHVTVWIVQSHTIVNWMCQKFQLLADVLGLGPVCRKTRKLFGPVKSFLVHLCLKSEKCMGLKLLVWRQSLLTLRNVNKTALSSHESRFYYGFPGAKSFQDLPEKGPWGAFLKRPGKFPGPQSFRAFRETCPWPFFSAKF